MSTSAKEIKEKDVEREKKRRRTIKTEIRSQSPTTGVTEIKKIKVEPKTSLSTKAIYAAEEAEVDKRDPLDDLASQKAACNEVRRMMAIIRDLKESNGSESKTEEARIQATLQFVTIKRLNRLAQIRCRKARDTTSESKLKLDHKHLQLQNLLYEVTHLQKEITKCLEFKSKDEDIDLVNIDEFYKDAPADISKPDVTKNDPHQQKLARLDWELEQRKRLAKKLGEASGSKDILVQESKTKREYLESLQPKLNNILAATKPVQEYMDMPFDDIREQHCTARYLPRPLYVLYMHASAFKDACDKDLTVSIHGDTDVAKALCNQTEDVEEDSDSDPEDEGKRSSKRRRRRAEDRKTQKKQKMLKKHPLTVVLDVKCKDGSVLHLTFVYLISFGIVTVTVKLTPGTETTFTSISGGDLMSPDTILMCLYPDDLGMDTPNPSNNYALNRLGLGEFSTYISEVGRPYDWVQRMAGLQFLRVQPDDEEMKCEVKTAISASCMEDTIKRYRVRVRARQALQKQLASLERSTIPVASEDMDLFPAKISTRLTQWKRTTSNDFMVLPYTARMINEGIGKEWDLYFVGTMERGSAKLTFHVVMSPDYPKSAPVFAINIMWKHQRNNLNDEHVRDMEAEVNIHYDELLQNKTEDQLLSNQVQRLLMCFDVYLETESENSAMEGPIEFSKDKIFPRFTRGPGRCKPYVYQYKMGFFSQR